MNDSIRETHTYVLDSTAIIHFLPNDRINSTNANIIIPAILKDEIKSFQAKTILEVMTVDRKLIFVSPSIESLKKVNEAAKTSGDFSNLSDADIHVIATALDFPSSHVISDDNAVQNLCSLLGIKVETFIFKIKTIRVYYWKCIGCKSIFKKKIDICPECGNKLKRFYKKKKIQNQ